MTAWRPSAGPEAARTRAAMAGRLREYFAAAGVLEVETPALSRYAVSDPHIETFAIADAAVSPHTLYLQTSPEFCMKRLLAAGYPDIYSLCRVFRDGEAGRRHQPEFTMVEWYRRGFGLDEIIADTLGLVWATLAQDEAMEAQRYDYRQLFLEAVGLDPLAAPVQSLADAAGADDALRDRLGARRDDWLDLVLGLRIVPELPRDRLTVVSHYPASQAALARLCPDDPGVADRFEIFCGPVELANGYVELTDAAEQAGRFERDNAERARRGRPTRPVDTALLAALQHGLPDCAGVALGFERLLMLAAGSDDIRDVITFAFEDSA